MTAKERGATVTEAAMKYTSSIAACAAGTLVGTLFLAHCGNSGSGTTGGLGGSSTGGSTTTTTTCNTSTPLSCDVNNGGVDPQSGFLTDFTTAGDIADGGADAGFDGGPPMVTWNNATGKWGVASNLTGSVFAYNGGGGTDTWPSMPTVANRAMSQTGNIASGDYAGIGMSFDQCVDSTKFTGITFTLTGNKAGCTLQFQLQTLDQQSVSNHGLCPCGNTCYAFPKATINTPISSTPTTITLMMTDLTMGQTAAGTTAMPADFEKEMIGFQWHFQAGMSGACTGVSISVTDVAFTM
jgi:hypothetical protein